MTAPQGRKHLYSTILQRILLLSAMGWLLMVPGIGAPGTQKRVLLLYDARNDMVGNTVVDRAIRSSLNHEFDVGLDIRSEYYEASGVAQDYRPLVNWLTYKYAGIPFDVVVPVGSNALEFASAYARDLFPGAQVVFWGRRDAITNWKSESPVTGVVAPDMERHFEATFDLIRRLQPDLERLIVVSGASAVDRRWEAAARSIMRRYEGRFGVSYLAAPTLEDLQTRLADLPRMTAVVFLTMNEDGAGRRLLKSDVLRKVVQTSSAPVYSTSAVYLDTGIVGGALVNQETLANETAIVVARLLRGQRTRDIPIREASLTPTVNWRQLRNWKIPESRIPSGTVVIQKDLTAWEQYKWPIIGVLSLCIFEAMLITALLILRARRKRAEKSLRESRRLLQSIIDGLNAQIALLDADGKIAAVNQAWLRFGQGNGDAGTGNEIGRAYLDVCKSGIRSGEPAIVSGAVKDLISGTRADFSCIYESANIAERPWFQLRMSRFYIDEWPWVIMEYENVTEIKQAHAALQELTGLLSRAQDDERRRIARDLHAVSVQNVATIKAVFAGVQRAAHHMDVRTCEKIDEGLVLSDQVIKDLRTLSYVLHPPLLDELGLIPALQWFVRGFMERTGLQVELQVKGRFGRLKPELETALFRVAQESLASIHRHSGSAAATICATQDEAAVVLQITDRGRAFRRVPAPWNQAGLHGVGIVGLRERLRQLGGELEVESDDQGTTVTARVLTTEAILCRVF